jgi:hypothetical protein
MPSPASFIIVSSLSCAPLGYGGLLIPWITPTFRIANVVSKLGVVGKYRVRLFIRKTSICIREVWSDSSGYYCFNNIPFIANGYFVAAFDAANIPVNAAIGDFISPEPMPS